MNVCISNYHDYSSLRDNPILAPCTFISSYMENKAPKLISILEPPGRNASKSVVSMI